MYPGFCQTNKQNVIKHKQTVKTAIVSHKLRYNDIFVHQVLLYLAFHHSNIISPSPVAAASPLSQQPPSSGCSDHLSPPGTYSSNQL